MIDRPIRPLWPKGYRNEVQCIATVLSADLITSHDILAINGVSAALMISPMPFLGPIGAVRIGLIDGELVVNPTLPEAEEDGGLDLIVVGTKDGLTMVEAGADQVPEDDAARGARHRAARDREALRGAGGAPREAGKPKWLDPGVTERDRRRGSARRSSTASARMACTTATRSSGRSSSARAGGLSMDSTEKHIVRELQVRMSLAQVLEKKRSRAARRRCVSSSRTTCAR